MERGGDQVGGSGWGLGFILNSQSLSQLGDVPWVGPWVTFLSSGGAGVTGVTGPPKSIPSTAGIWNSTGMGEAPRRCHPWGDRGRVPPARGGLWALSEGLGDSRDTAGVAGTGCEGG